MITFVLFSQIASIDDVINSQRGLLESFSGLTGNERKEAMQRALKITRTRAEVEHLLRTTDLSESEIARQLGLRPDLIYRMKKTLMPGRPTQISKAYERREREREEKEQKPKQAQQTKPIKKNNLAPTKKVDATKEAKKRQYITEKKEEIKTNSNIATIRNALSKYGVSFKALIEIYSVMDIPVERGGFLFVKVSADIGEINTRMVYQKLSQTFSTDSLILIEMDRLWGINPERLIRNPDGIRNIAIRNLKEFGIIR